jgi:non-heme Fe2+,alpha-ketoglutarate-dependent halogenase
MTRALKALTEDQVTFYHENGYLAPLEGVSAAEAAAMRDDLAAFERAEGTSAGNINMKGHLCFRRSYDLTFAEPILDVVEDLIGPNILAFASRFWIKKGLDGNYVSWHQDSAYFGLEPHELVTVWLALSDATEEMGCMRVIPGSHRGEAYSHVETFHEKNLLARGQRIDGIDESKSVFMPLRAGQFSCHHERILHSSEPNRTPVDRIGLGIFYIPTHVKSTIGRRTACLVRGVDEYGYWDADPVPCDDVYDSGLFAHMQEAGRRYVDPQYRQEAEAG